jgi:trk system potassium uptake protein TrkA
MAQRVLVVGLGRFGSTLAQGLGELGCEVVGVDLRMEFVEANKNDVAWALALDATDPAALRSIEAGSCAVAVVAMGEDFEAEILSVSALKECGVARVIARAHDSRQARILRAVGADEVIEVESEIGRRLATTLAGELKENGREPRANRGG